MRPSKVPTRVRAGIPRTELPVDVGKGETVQGSHEGEGGHPELVVRVHEEVGEVGAEQNDPVHRINVCLID